MSALSRVHSLDRGVHSPALEESTVYSVIDSKWQPDKNWPMRATAWRNAGSKRFLFSYPDPLGCAAERPGYHAWPGCSKALLGGGTLRPRAFRLASEDGEDDIKSGRSPSEFYGTKHLRAIAGQPLGVGPLVVRFHSCRTVCFCLNNSGDHKRFAQIYSQAAEVVRLAVQSPTNQVRNLLKRTFSQAGSIMPP